MAPLVVMAGLGILAGVVPGLLAQPLTGTQATRALEAGDRLLKEKSFALALREYNKVLPPDSGSWIGNRDSTIRHALARAGLCHWGLNQISEAAQKLQALTLDDKEGKPTTTTEGLESDQWTLEALRTLTTGLDGTPDQIQMIYYQGTDYTYGPTAQRAWTRRVLRLDALLENQKPQPDWAQDWRLAVVRHLPSIDASIPPTVEQGRSGLVQLHQRAVAGAGANEETLAELALIRAQAHPVLDGGSRTTEDWMREYEQVAVEFPGTKSGAIALMFIANHHAGQGKYLKALEVARRIQKDFSRTPTAEEAAEMERNLLKPEAMVLLPNVAEPDQPVEMKLRHRNTDQVTVVLESFDLMERFRTTRRLDLNFDQLRGRKVLEQSFDLTRPEDLITTETSLNLGKLERGAYILRLTGRGPNGQIESMERAFLVSRSAMVWRATADGPSLWVVDRVTGKPRPGATVLLGKHIEYVRPTVGQGYQQVRSFETATTDQDGLATKWSGPTRGEEYNQTLAIADAGGDLAMTGILGNYWMDEIHSQGRKAYIYFDRPAARPGQTVHWRAIIREERDGRFESPGRIAVRYTVTDARGEEFKAASGQKDSTDLGTVSGSIEVPMNAPLGAWSIRLQDSSSGQHLGQESIQIEEYRKPEYEVTVSLGDGTQAILGHKVQGEVQARFYRGDAVAGGRVTWTVKRRQTYVSTDRFDADPDLGWFDTNEADINPNSRVNSGGDIVAQGEGVLDSEGKLKFEFLAEPPTGWTRPDQGGPMPYYPGMARGRGHWGNWWWWGEPAFEFQVEATVVDSARRSIDGGAKLTIGERAMEWALSPQRTLLEPGDRARLKVSAFRLDGQRLATDGKISIERREWIEERGEDKITTVGTLSVRTLTDMPQWVEFTIPKGRDQSGRWRFVIQGTDQFGNSVATYREVIVADGRTANVFLRNEGIRLMVDRRILGPDDTARILVDTPKSGNTILLELLAGNRVLHRQVLAMDGRSRLLTLPVNEGWTPNVLVAATTVRDNQLHTEKQEILVPPVRQTLTVNMRTDRSRYQPGQTARVTLEALDSDGRPVDAEFSLSAYDSSLTYIAPDTREDVRRFFYGKRRPVAQEDPALSLNMGWYYGQNEGGVTPYFYRMALGDGSDRYDAATAELAANGSPRRRMMSQRALAGAMVGEGMAMTASAPMPAASLADAEVSNYKLVGRDEPSSNEVSVGQGATPEQPTVGEMPRVRTDFRDVAQWLPTLRTGREGVITAEVPLPDSLTRWSLVAVGADGGSRVGNQTTATIVTKDLITRLEPPRFLVERDELLVAAIVQSNLPTTETVEVTLTARGPLGAVGTAPRSASANEITLLRQSVAVGPGIPLRLDVPVVAGQPGDAILTLSAKVIGGSNAGTGDALERTVPVIEYGAMQYLAWAGSMDQGTTTPSGWTMAQAVTLPAGTSRGTTRVRVDVQPTLLRALRDGLPYLVEYPYGCVEQTVSRFAPAAAVLGVAQKLNLPLDKSLSEKLPEVMRIGVDRLRTMQKGDGGWGWWSGDTGNPYMTAFVAYSLTMARDAEASVPQDMLDAALRKIEADLSRKRDKDDRSWYYGWNNSLHTEVLQALVLTLNNRRVPAEVIERLWTLRTDLRPHGLAMLVRVLHGNNRTADAEVALRNLDNFAVINEELGTMHWGDRDRGWYWWDDAVESTAMGLQAHLDLNPNSMEARRAMAWLVMNRRGGRWKSTKDTAAAIFALTRWTLMRQEGATTADFTVRLVDQANGKPVAEHQFRITPADLWTGEFHLDLSGDAIPESGKLLVQIEQTSGEAPGYFGISAEFLNRSEQIEAAGRELQVVRSYHRVVRVEPGTADPDGTATPGSGRGVSASSAVAGRWMPRPRPTPAKPDGTIAAEERLVPLKDGDELQPGDMVEVTLNLTTSNDFDYLLIEDPKPATFEPTNVQSGSTYGDGLCSNVELRDRHVAFFITLLREGKHTLKYRVRAESAGSFRALPSQGSSMYVPELRANSASGRIRVTDNTATVATGVTGQ